MDFEPSSKAQETCIRTWNFMREEVIPAESEYDESWHCFKQCRLA